MLRFTKSALAVLVLGSSSLFAGTMGPVCVPGNVTVPCEWQGWDFGVKALYLQSTYDVDYGYGPYRSSDNITRYYPDVNTDWHWGFMLEASYHFNTGNDLNLNWYHWKNDIDYSYAGAFTPGFNAGLYGTTRFEPQWDAVNLEFGQHVDFGEFKDIRFHAGIQYARIKNETRSSGYIIPGALPFYLSIDNTFNGLGPRVGMDMTYNFGNGLAIFGNSAAAILVGDSKFNTGATILSVLGLAANGSKTTIVPELEAKLGAKYGWAMTQGKLTIDAGWMWVNYFNPTHFIGVLGGNNESNFALHGPFIGLNWLGNL
ncbi:Lpg1974 family pore-forming outer membrane protein [Legionella hackeliae]|uniref:Major outer membrane protein n=1 Tax=Legionella hackeliae TaxID=449 RepID=A0A0A8UQV6_LEGHA|nr:Lpg1974 family pore-forming outer membrane protein [Legionella hackeliae]KTD14892.1 major outer membrane protein [Legionella hackeliae]CEK09482.1 Major outer membrane protein precursor [Legionella hackeliae]STX49388.1 major outer membrane protein [Legionella hackeliae]